MRFDAIIIGGGLAGLTCGLRLQKNGKQCAIISAGQSAMHFSSGSFDLLGRLPDGKEVSSLEESIKELDADHPYSVIGHETTLKYASQTKEFMESCGLRLSGDTLKNSWRITPTGERKPTWLTFSDFTPLSSKDEKIGNKVLIVNIAGFLDFNTKFLADSFEKQGTSCRIVSLKLEEMERLRKNPSEMRSTNIARVMDRDGIWEKAIAQVKSLINDEDTVVLPAVFGLKDEGILDQIRERIDIKTIFAATMPPSVPGIRTQMNLRAEFEKAGGRFFLGDSVTEAFTDEEGRIQAVKTSNFGDIKVYADDFILATGSFFSKGLIATPGNIYEPIFGIDLITEEKREKWFDRNFWDKQKYIGFGAKTDSKMNAYRNGAAVSNLYAIGSLIGGSNLLYEGSGAGVSVITALRAADVILEK